MPCLAPKETIALGLRQFLFQAGGIPLTPFMPQYAQCGNAMDAIARRIQSIIIRTDFQPQARHESPACPCTALMLLDQ